MHGSKCSTATRNASVPPVPHEKFWLFFTHLKNTVSESQMHGLVSTSIGSSDIIVKKLVADWKDITRLPYVSFEIGIDADYKDMVMLPSTWPAGVHFREFHNNYDL